MFRKFILIIYFFIFTSVVLPGERNFLFIPRGANFYIYRTGRDQFILNRSRFVKWKLQRNIARLSSGKRINSAADDAAGLAIAEKMSTLLDGLRREAHNAEDYRNFLNYAESVLAQNQEILKKIRLLILRSSSGILGPEDRKINQAEIDQLKSQINMNAEFSQFNKKRIIPGLTTAGLGLDGVNVVTNLYGSIGLVDSALKKIMRHRILAGIKSNILFFRIKGKNYYYLNLQEAESRIRDLDMAEGISSLVKNHILLKTRYGILMLGK